MLLALVSARDHVPGEGDRLVAELPIAGRSIIERQVRFALDRGAKRIICLADSPRRSLVELQHLVEKAGAGFVLATSRLSLAGAATAEHRLLVIAEGVVFDRAVSALIDTERPAIVAFPATTAVANGFERIDRDRAWAGIMILRASLIERLNDLPEDMDSISSLLRLGLQAGTQVVMPLSDSLPAEQWGVVVGPDRASEWSRAEISRALKPVRWYWPAQSLAQGAVQRIAARKIGLRRWLLGMGSASLIALLSAVALAFAGHAFTALLVAGGAAFASTCSFGFAAIGSNKPCDAKRPEFMRTVSLVAIDLAILVAVVMAAPGYAREEVAFAALVLAGLLHLLPLIGERFTVPLVSDRSILAWALAVGVVLAIFHQMVQGFALASLLFGLVLLLRARLTRA